MHSVRVCMVPVSRILEIKKSGSAITGAAAPLVQLLLETTSGLNVSYALEERIGNLIDGSSSRYDGCIGSLQSNDSDTLLPGLTRFPTFGPNLRNGVVITADRLGTLSAYKQIDASKDYIRTDVMEMFAALSPAVWVLVVAVYLAAFLYMLTAAKALFRKRKPSTRHILLRATQVLLACLLRQYSSLPSRFMRRTSMTAILFVACVAAFLIIFYLTSMIKTDMVVYKLPETIQSFVELLSSGRQPAWIEFLGDTNNFRFALSDSMKGRLWSRAVQMSKQYSMLGANPASLMEHAMRIAKLQEALVLHENKAKIFLRFACAYARTQSIMMETNGLFRRESDEGDDMASLLTNYLTKPAVVHIISHRAQRLSQAHLLEAAIERIELADNLGIRHPESVFTQIQSCASGMITLVEPDLMPVSLIHYSSLALLVGTFFAMATVAWLIEVSMCRCHKRKRVAAA